MSEKVEKQMDKILIERGYLNKLNKKQLEKFEEFVKLYIQPNFNLFDGNIPQVIAYPDIVESEYGYVIENMDDKEYIEFIIEKTQEIYDKYRDEDQGEEL